MVVDEAGHRFVLEQDGHSAELVYRSTGNRLNLVHTEVPEQLRGRGLGGRLVRAAIDLAIAQNLVVIPTCPYAQEWLRAHPDEAGTVAIRWPVSARRGQDRDYRSEKGERDG
ncbi:MAG: GNAT family N-acetyltransferase [Nitrososphaerales archaeon]